MSDIHDIINDVCYSLAVAALLGILVFIILADVNISDDMPIWKSQLLASTVGALLTAAAALSAIHYKKWWDNRIYIEVKINDYEELDEYSEVDQQWFDFREFMDVSIRNRSSIKAVVLDSFWLNLHYDGEDHLLSTKYVLERGEIHLPYELLPGKKLSVSLGDLREYRENYFLDHDTGDYNYPNTGCDLIAYFEDQLGEIHRSPPNKIL